jgi:TRAP-type C4-dicarboxylate transport system permease small subunit
MTAILKLMDGLIRLTHNVAAVMLAVAAALVFYQVITRFILGDSAVWSEVLARAVIVWGVFLIMGPASRQNSMIPIDVIRGLFPENKQIWIIRLVTVAVGLFLLILLWYGYKMTLRVVHQQVAMLNVSVAWFYVAIPVGAALALPGLALAHIDAETLHRTQAEAAK